MKPEWTKTIVSGIITHFYEVLNATGIKTFVEGMARDTGAVSEWFEIRVTELYWKQIDATGWQCRFAVNVWINTQSGQDLVNGTDIYRVEELLGIAEQTFIGFHIEGFGCASQVDELRQFRPRQIAPDSNRKEASVTGQFLLRFEGDK